MLDSVATICTEVIDGFCEDGEADLVQAADRLSFLETNVDLFLGFVESGRFSIDDVRTKFEHSYHRIRVPDAKALARPLYEDADARLALLATRVDGVA